MQKERPGPGIRGNGDFVKRRKHTKRKVIKRVIRKARDIKRPNSPKTSPIALAGAAANPKDRHAGVLTRIFSDTEKQNLDTEVPLGMLGLPARIRLPAEDEGYLRTPLAGPTRLAAEKRRRIDETWLRISANRDGNRALHVLANVGIDREKLIGHLWLIRSVHGKKRTNLASVPGVPLDTIKKLPDVLRRISRQVEAIEKHGCRPMFSPRLPARYMLGNKIPAFLRSYADWISELLSMRRNRAERNLDPSTKFKVQLVQLALDKSSDRRQHYGELATAINVFYAIEGVRQTVTAESLKVLWKSHPTLRKLPEPIKYPLAIQPKHWFSS
jgi:hypothetical protein